MFTHMNIYNYWAAAIALEFSSLFQSSSLSAGVPATSLELLSLGVLCVMNWHFSHSFRLIFLNTNDLYPSRSCLINLTTLVSYHFACSLSSQIMRKHEYWNPRHSRHDVCTTTGDPFPNKTKHKLYSIRVKPQARPSKKTLPPGLENPPGRSSRSWLRHSPHRQPCG